MKINYEQKINKHTTHILIESIYNSTNILRLNVISLKQK